MFIRLTPPFIPLVLGILLLTGVPIQALGQIPGEEAFAVLRARSLGPGGIGGWITAVDGIAEDPNTVYVGTAGGGLWKTTNGGQTWEPVLDWAPSIGSLAIFQPDPEILWVGRGQGGAADPSGPGAGVYRSVDGGRSWISLGFEDIEGVHRIVLHPADPDIAYVGILGPTWGESDKRGVFKTTDGGSTWEQVLFMGRWTGTSDLVMNPSNPEELLAGMWEFQGVSGSFEARRPGGGLYMTEDAGKSWIRITEESGLPNDDWGSVRLTFSGGQGHVVYAQVATDRPALFRSADGGRGWRRIEGGPQQSGMPFRAAGVVGDPQREDRIFALGSGLLLSEDQGQTFHRISKDMGAPLTTLWISPKDPHLMYAGSNGGGYVTRDGGANWRLIDNLPVGRLSHVSVDLETPFHVYGGMDEEGAWRGPSTVWKEDGILNAHWTEVRDGGGSSVLSDPADPGVLYTLSPGGGLVLHDLRSGETRGIRPWAPDTVPLRFNRHAPIAMDPFDTATVYLGSQFVHKTRNRGTTWEIISPDLTTNDPQRQSGAAAGERAGARMGEEAYAALTAIAPSPAERELIWVGSDDGQVHLTRSGGGHWENVGGRIRGAPEGARVAHIEPSRREGATAYVVLDDHRRGDRSPIIFRTENYGRDWRRVAAEGPLNGIVHTLLVAPGSERLLLAGTETGLWVSLDRGDDWLLWKHGLPSVPVTSLVVHPRDDDLIIGTRGRGIYILDHIGPLREIADRPQILSQSVHLFEPPFSYLYPAPAEGGHRFRGDAVFRGESRPFGALLSYWVANGREGDEARVEILDSNNRVVASLIGSAHPGMNRIAWNLREDVPDLWSGAGPEPIPALPGPEVLPGRYRVRVRVPDGDAEASLQVLSDPDGVVSSEDGILRQEAARLGIELVISTEGLLRTYREAFAAVGGLAASLEARRGPEPDSLEVAAREVLRQLEGLRDDIEALERSRQQIESIPTARGAPIEGERIALSRMEDRLERTMNRFNGLLITRVKDLRSASSAAGFGEIPEFRVVIRRRWR